MSELEIDLTVTPKSTMSFFETIESIRRNEVRYSELNLDYSDSDIMDYKRLYIDKNNIGFKKLELKYNLNRENKNCGSYIVNMSYFNNINISYFKNEIIKVFNDIKNDRIDFVCRNISKEYLFDEKYRDINIIPVFLGFKYNVDTFYYFNNMIYIHKSILDRETEQYYFITTLCDKKTILDNILFNLTSKILESSKNDYGYWW